MHAIPGRERRVHDVPNLAGIVVDDVHDPARAERAGIERLAAGRRVERRLVEHDDRTAAVDVARDDGGVELTLQRVGVIEATRRHGVRSCIATLEHMVSSVLYDKTGIGFPANVAIQDLTPKLL